MMRVRLAILCACLPCGASAELTEDMINAKVEAIQSWMAEQPEPPPPEAVVARLSEMVKDIDVSTLSMPEISRAAFLLMETEGTRKALADRVAALAKQDSSEGFEAAVLRLLLSLGEPNGAVGTQLGAALEHPGATEALKKGKGYELFSVLEMIPKEALSQHSPALIRLIDRVPTFVDGETLAHLGGYVQVLSAFEDLAPERREAILEQVMARFDAAIDRAREEGKSELADMLEDQVGYARGAAARGELIGRPAPALDLEWVSSGRQVTGLDAFIGKVVVIDFWATWCGPCISSFPKLRELRGQYDPEEVVILGVTSLQGAHYARGKPPEDTTDRPEREYELMKEFMKEMDVTWTVAFSQQDVFNRAFGVQGIPHLALVAADGTVRYNGLSPHGELSDKTSKIDELLAERNKSL